MRNFCHAADDTINLLKLFIPGRLISQKGDDYDWPPRSPDLTQLDYYLWGYLKSKVYIDKPWTLAQLKTNIEREIAVIPRATLEKVIENAEKWAHYAIRAKGDQLNQIILEK